MKGSSRFKGQALVELALGLPLLLLLIFGVMELGRAFFVKIAMSNAAREGANYFVYHPDDVDLGFFHTVEHIKKEIANSGLDFTDEEILVQCLDVIIDPNTKEITDNIVNPNCPGLSTIEVVITNQHQVTIFGYLIGGIEMSANARMVIP